MNLHVTPTAYWATMIFVFLVAALIMSKFFATKELNERHNKDGKEDE